MFLPSFLYVFEGIIRRTTIGWIKVEGNTKINELEVQIKELIEENKQISDKNDKLQQENAELKAALEQLAKTIKENQDGQM